MTDTNKQRKEAMSQKRSRLGGLLPVLAAPLIYAGVSIAAAASLTRPKRRIAFGVSPAVYDLESRDVQFPARGGDAKISGWYIPCGDSQRVVVLVHGMGISRGLEMYGRFLELAQALHRRDFAVLMIDLRGHGFSGPGRFSFGLNERRDVIGAADWLKTQGFQPGSIGILGVSMGAAACLGAAADDPDIGAIVSDCGFADVLPVMRAEFARESGLPGFFLPGVIRAARLLFGYDISQSRPIDEAGRIHGALLLIQGMEDKMVLPENALRLKEAAPNAELWMVPGAIHAGSFGADPREYARRVGDFFDANLKGESNGG